MREHLFGLLLGVGALIMGLTGTASAEVPWDVFDDTISVSTCDLINAENALLVVDSVSGVLVIVDGPDVYLADTYVDIDGNVYYLGEPAGFISWDWDGDGFRTLWWLGLNGRVVSVDGFTGEPGVTDLLPEDFYDVPCDACDYWDDQSVCTDVIIVDPGDDDDVIVIEPDDDENVWPVNVSFCGASADVALAGTLVGLLGLSLVRRRGQ
ncbi:MAG TPA: hypothetical protein PKK06_10925 [Phycisphaerae bacterium]|nr:hypothetical protein [Phycisphaerae bacterium]HNU44328.1 hypothetical protein [Phycisphaerae bacterium]